MRKVGHNPEVLEKRAARLLEAKEAAWEASEAQSSTMDVDMDMDGESSAAGGAGAGTKKSARSAVRTPRGNRQLIGMATKEQDDKAVALRNFAQRLPNRLAKASESDRHVPITRPKWMLAGKRKGGKTERR